MWNTKFTIHSRWVSTLAFHEIVEKYEAQYLEPSKFSIEASITNWIATTKKEPEHTDIELKKTCGSQMTK